MEPDRTALLLIIGRQTVRIASLEAQVAQLLRRAQEAEARAAAPAAIEDAEG